MGRWTSKEDEANGEMKHPPDTPASRFKLRWLRPHELGHRGALCLINTSYLTTAERYPHRDGFSVRKPMTVLLSTIKQMSSQRQFFNGSLFEQRPLFQQRRLSNRGAYSNRGPYSNKGTYLFPAIATRHIGHVLPFPRRDPHWHGYIRRFFHRICLIQRASLTISVLCSAV